MLRKNSAIASILQAGEKASFCLAPFWRVFQNENNTRALELVESSAQRSQKSPCWDLVCQNRRVGIAQVRNCAAVSHAVAAYSRDSYPLDQYGFNPFPICRKLASKSMVSRCFEAGRSRWNTLKNWQRDSGVSPAVVDSTAVPDTLHPARNLNLSASRVPLGRCRPCRQLQPHRSHN